MEISGVWIMKKLVVLFGCAILFCGFTGCQEGEKTESFIDVIVLGGGKFPQFFIGKWKPDNAGWEFVFEPDGTISSAVIDGGMLRVNPEERVAKIPLKYDGVGTYELGRWMVQYTPENRELAVEIVVDHFHLDMKTYGIEGHTTDLFVGPVLEDEQTWKAEWFTFPKIFALTPEPSELAFDPNDNPKETLLFKKQAKEN